MVSRPAERYVKAASATVEGESGIADKREWISDPEMESSFSSSGEVEGGGEEEMDLASRMARDTISRPNFLTVEMDWRNLWPKKNSVRG